MSSFREVYDFWFSEDNKDKWFVEDKDFDKKIEVRFYTIWEEAKEGLLVSWRENIKGRLAEIIVLDQFSRNLFRGDIRSYKQDPMALVLAQEAVKKEEFASLEKEEQSFILMPFMHSESYALHKWAEKLFQNYGTKETLEFENKHKLVLKKFGRYPFRNEIFGRESSEEEEKIFGDFMGNFSFPEELEREIKNSI